MAWNLKGIGGTIGSAIKDVDLALHDLKPHSNEAINKITSNKAVQSVIKAMDKPIDMISKENLVHDRLNSVLNNETQYGARDYVRMGLGTYAAASVAGRVVSGGGLYRDSKGNFDVAGIPII